MCDAFVVKLANFDQDKQICSRLMICTWHLPWQHLINTHSSQRYMCIYACVCITTCACMCVAVKRLKRNHSGSRRLVPGCVKRCDAWPSALLRNCHHTHIHHADTRRKTPTEQHTRCCNSLTPCDTHSHRHPHCNLTIPV